jgi:formamidopyrimidine-DNA glycosylase
MQGARIDRVELRRPDLRRPFPADFVSRLTGQTVRSITRRGKYLLAGLGSGDTLLIHLGMSGAFRTARTRRRGRRSTMSDPHDHVIMTLSSGVVVTFNDPRRFGLMDLIRAEEGAHSALRSIGPEPLDTGFGAAALARACAKQRASLKVRLLDQRLVAGLGNIYASEALHLAGLSPHRRASTIATATGAPRESAFRLAAAIKAVLRKAMKTGRRAGQSDRFRVYEREGEACPKPDCPGTIRRVIQASRSTYYCPVCQR